MEIPLGRESERLSQKRTPSTCPVLDEEDTKLSARRNYGHDQYVFTICYILILQTFLHDTPGQTCHNWWFVKWGYCLITVRAIIAYDARSVFEERRIIGRLVPPLFWSPTKFERSAHLERYTGKAKTRTRKSQVFRCQKSFLPLTFPNPRVIENSHFCLEDTALLSEAWVLLRRFLSNSSVTFSTSLFLSRTLLSSVCHDLMLRVFSMHDFEFSTNFGVSWPAEAPTFRSLRASLESQCGWSRRSITV